MKGTLPHIIIVILLFNPAGSFNAASQKTSQNSTADGTAREVMRIPWEEVFLHTDRNKYVAGEDVWLSIYNIDPSTGKLSSSGIIAYVELLNPWNTSVVQARYSISGGRGSGSFAIPDTVSSGTFIIRAYTYWMKNFLPENCFMAYIDIYNPFKDSDFLSISDSSAVPLKSMESSRSGNESIFVSPADSVYGRREKVTVTAGSLNNGGGSRQILSDLSISVSPLASSSEIQRKAFGNGYGNGLETYPFENEGNFLKGKINYRNVSVPDSSHFLYMSVQGKVAGFRYADIDSSGRFTFILPPDSRKRNLILQPDHPRNDMVLEIESSFSELLPERVTKSRSLTRSESEIFSILSFNYQVSRIYGIGSRILPETNNNGEVRKRRFYGIPEMEIYLRDYVRLPSMQEVFFELLPGIIIRPGKAGYEMKITNPLTGVYYNEPPLVMIDGVIINDLNILVDLDPETVEKIEVVKTPYLIGDMILHGIVNVITVSGDFSNITMPDYAVILPYRVIERPSLFIAPDYSDRQLRNGRKPDLRNTLFWNPSVKTGSSGVAEIEFWTSDQPGKYRISICGVTETGKIVSACTTFNVR